MRAKLTMNTNKSGVQCSALALSEGRLRGWPRAVGPDGLGLAWHRNNGMPYVSYVLSEHPYILPVHRLRRNTAVVNLANAVVEYAAHRVIGSRQHTRRSDNNRYPYDRVSPTWKQHRRRPSLVICAVSSDAHGLSAGFAQSFTTYDRLEDAKRIRRRRDTADHIQRSRCLTRSAYVLGRPAGSKQHLQRRRTTASAPHKPRPASPSPRSRQSVNPRMPAQNRSAGISESNAFHLIRTN